MASFTFLSMISLCSVVPSFAWRAGHAVNTRYTIFACLAPLSRRAWVSPLTRISPLPLWPMGSHWTVVANRANAARRALLSFWPWRTGVTRFTCRGRSGGWEERVRRGEGLKKNEDKKTSDP